MKHKLRQTWESTKRLWNNAISFDQRSLEAFRIALGALLILDAILKWGMLEALFSDTGIIPTSEWKGIRPQKWYWSFHLASGELWFQQILATLQIGIGACIALGVKTRLMLILGWLFVASASNRMSYSISGADSLLRAAMLFACFLPLGTMWSLSTKWSTNKWIPATITKVKNGLPVLAYSLQICIVYISTAIYKSNSYWLEDFTAVYKALSLESFRSPIGDMVYQLPWLLPPLTGWTMIVEYLGPLLLLIPLRQEKNWAKLIGFLMLFTLQIGFGSNMTLGIFPLVGMVTLLPFIPSLAWNWVPKLRFPSQPWYALRHAVQAKKQSWKGKIYATGRIITGAILIGLMTIITLWDYDAHSETYTKPTIVRKLGYGLNISQNWKMFARPSTADGWLSSKGITRNDAEVEVWRSLHAEDIVPFTDERPEHLAENFPTNRWRKYIRNLTNTKTRNYKRRRTLFAAYLCRQYNDDIAMRTSEKLRKVELIYRKEKTLADYNRRENGQLELTTYNCKD